MAKRQPTAPTPGTCRECEHSYDYHSESYRTPGKMILCRCPYQQHAKLLDHDNCKKDFKRRDPAHIRK